MYRRQQPNPGMDTDEHPHCIELRSTGSYIVVISLAKLTKTQAKRRLKEIDSKAFKLYEHDFISMKDMEAIRKIVKYRSKQC